MDSIPTISSILKHKTLPQVLPGFTSPDVTTIPKPTTPSIQNESDYVEVAKMERRANRKETGGCKGSRGKGMDRSLEIGKHSKPEQGEGTEARAKGSAKSP